MIELPYDSFSAVAHLFTPKKQLIPAIAVIRGNYPGRVFVDQSTKAPCCCCLGYWKMDVFARGGNHCTTEDEHQAIYAG